MRAVVSALAANAQPAGKRGMASATTPSSLRALLLETQTKRSKLQQDFLELEQKHAKELASLLEQEAQLEAQLATFQHDGLAPVPAHSPQNKRAKLLDLTEITIHFDGASKGNPGDGGGGWIASTRERTLAFGWNHRPRCTNNEAEYIGLIESLQYVTSRVTATSKITIMGDSTIVVKQVLGQYKCKAENLIPFHNTATKLYMKLAITHGVSLNWVPREENKVADYLSNLAISQRGDQVFEFTSSDDPAIVVEEKYLKARFNPH